MLGLVTTSTCPVMYNHIYVINPHCSDLTTSPFDSCCVRAAGSLLVTGMIKGDPGGRAHCRKLTVSLKKLMQEILDCRTKKMRKYGVKQNNFEARTFLVYILQQSISINFCIVLSGLLLFCSKKWLKLQTIWNVFFIMSKIHCPGGFRTKNTQQHKQCGDIPLDSSPFFTYFYFH